MTPATSPGDGATHVLPMSAFVSDISAAPIRVVDHWRKANGELIEVAHVWALKGAWGERPESREPTWRVCDFGPFVLAYRIAE